MRRTAIGVFLTLALDKAPREVLLDPDLWVLMEATSTRR
jgi:hypothetical protein